MENKEFVFVLTHSYDAIERAAAALQLAAGSFNNRRSPS